MHKAQSPAKTPCSRCKLRWIGQIPVARSLFQPWRGQCCRGFIRIMMTIMIHLTPLRPGQAPGAVPRLRENDRKRQNCCIYEQKNGARNMQSRRNLVLQARAGSTWRGPVQKWRSKIVHGAEYRTRGVDSTHDCRNGWESVGKPGTARTKTKQPGVDIDPGCIWETPPTTFSGQMGVRSPSSYTVKRRPTFTHVFRRNPRAFSMTQ